MSNFNLSLENKVRKIIPDFAERRKQVLINSGHLFFNDVSEFDLSVYQVAFIELFFDIRHEIIGSLNKELDAVFILNREWSGASFEGVSPPSDNSTDWKYMIGLFKGGLTRVAYLEFQFNEWSIKRYSIQSSID